MMHQAIRPTGLREANYIVYLLDGDGRFRAAEWIAASSDADALRQVRGLGHRFDCELWQQARRIGTVSPAT